MEFRVRRFGPLRIITHFKSMWYFRYKKDPFYKWELSLGKIEINRPNNLRWFS